MMFDVCAYGWHTEDEKKKHLQESYNLFISFRQLLI